MMLEQIKPLVAQVWDYKLNLRDERDRFLDEVSEPIEFAIATDDREVIDYLVSLFPIERFYLQVAIQYGCKYNPDAGELLITLAEDKAHYNAVSKALEDKCGNSVCNNPDACTALHENLADGIQLHPKEIELYKKWCAMAFMEFEPG
jgi:hypothetical protein